jgi:hypothetical protein
MEAVEARREFLICSATSAIAAEQFDRALMDLDAAEQLRAGLEIRRLRACTFLLAGDFAGARAEHGDIARP